LADLKRAVEDPAIPEALRQPAGGRRRCAKNTFRCRNVGRRRHAKRWVPVRNARRVLDEFAPDFVVIWGDDQYENF